MGLVIAVLLGGAMAAGEPPARAEAERLAREALAAELGVEPGGLEVRLVEEVEWPDASLGCPEKGIVYAQVITAGYRVRLEHAGRTHEIHVGAGRAVRCDSPARRSRVPPESIRAVAQAAALAREVLAHRLGLEQADVSVRRVRAFAADDRTRCPDLDDAEVEAQLVELEAAGRTYFYRVAGARVEACEGASRPNDEKKGGGA